MTAKKYQFLLESFLDEKLSVSDFETRYLAVFKAEPQGMSPDIFKILDQLFADVDAYSPYCSPDQENSFRISEASLRKRASLALKELEKLLAKH